MAKDAEKKISQLQVLEQNFQSVLQQKQTFQTQKLEVEYALKELDNSKGDAYKIVGPIMVKSNKEDLKKDLDSKKEAIDVRMKAIGKQEEQLKEKVESLQKEIVGEIGKNE